MAYEDLLRPSQRALTPQELEQHAREVRYPRGNAKSEEEDIAEQMEEREQYEAAVLAMCANDDEVRLVNAYFFPFTSAEGRSEEARRLVLRLEAQVQTAKDVAAAPEPLPLTVDKIVQMQETVQRDLQNRLADDE